MTLLAAASLTAMALTVMAPSASTWAETWAENGDSSSFHSCNGIFTNKPCNEVEAELDSPLRPSAKKSPLPVGSTVATSVPKKAPASATTSATIKGTPSVAPPAPKLPSPMTGERPLETEVPLLPTPALTAKATLTAITVLAATPALTAPPERTNTPQYSPTASYSPTPQYSPTASVPKVDAKATAVAKSKKDLALHDLRMKLIKAKKSWEVDLDISAAVDSCTSITTSLEECRAVVSTLDDKLEERSNSARMAKIAEGKAKTEATSAANPQNSQSTVVIIQPQVRATATPLLVFDTGPLLPVDPKYQRGPHRLPGGDRHHTGGGRDNYHRPEPPAPASGQIVDTVPRKSDR